MPYQRFKIGDRVKARGFTDSDGRWNDPVPGLTVVSVQFLDWEYAPHWRCKARGDGLSYVEGNQEHFVLEESH